MITEIVLRYLHFLSIFVIFGILTAEHTLLKRTVARAEIVRLARMDMGYGVAAGVLLAAALTLWLGGYGKPAAFYTHNHVFHAKLGCFALVGLLSVYPTLFFLRHRRGDAADRVNVPALVIWTVRIELLLLAAIPLLAGLMAHGIGAY